jgi:hypothetical protein
MECKVAECPSPRYAKGFCIKHYSRWRKHGDPTVNLGERRAAPPLPTLHLPDGRPITVDMLSPQWAAVARRALAKVEVASSGCWNYTGALDPRGYGRCRNRDGTSLVHRVVFQAVVRDLAADELLDHACRNHACCNPLHLEPVSNKLNSRRGIGPAGTSARKTHCARGHEFTEANTWRNPRNGVRQCRKCNALRQRQTQSRRRARRTLSDSGVS